MRGELAEGRVDGVVERPRLGLHAVRGQGALAASGLGGGLVHVQQHGELRDETLHGPPVQFEHAFGAQPASRPLVRHGGVHEPVADHDLPALEGGADPARHVVRARGREQQCLGHRGHRRVGGIEHERAHRFREGCAPGLARGRHGTTVAAQGGHERRSLGGLPGAVTAFEHDEGPAR